MTVKKDGKRIEVKSKKDGKLSRAVAVDFATDDNLNGRIFCPVEGPVIWKLHQVIHALTSKEERDEMDAAGITPEQFLFPHLHQKYLMGRSCLIVAEQGGEYLNLNARPFPIGHEAAGLAGPQPDPSPDDVPF